MSLDINDSVQSNIPFIYNDTIDTSTIETVLLINSETEELNKYTNSNTFGIVYNSGSSRDELLAVLRSKFTNIKRVGIAFHYIDGEVFFLENEKLFTMDDLDTSSANTYSNNLQFIIDVVKEFNVTHLDYLACNTLQNENYKKYYSIITDKTNVVIGASDDKTGNIKYGGDWVLESTQEDVQNIYFSNEIVNYANLLAVTTYTVNNVNYRYDPAVNLIASVVASPSASGVVDILSSFVVDNVTYTVTSIQSTAFRLCTSLTSVTIPNSVISIGNSAFLGCSSLTSVTIPNSVTSIGSQAFQSTSLTSVTISNRVTFIGSLAFGNCRSLTSILVDAGNVSFTNNNNDGNLYNKDSSGNITTLLQYAIGKTDTSFIIPNGVTSIGNSTFLNCTSLTSVTIPLSVISIGSSAFNLCTSLTSVTIPTSVTSIGTSSFQNCTSLTSVTIPSSVTSIGSLAFNSCTSLTSIRIPARVTSFGNNAFGGIPTCPPQSSLQQAAVLYYGTQAVYNQFYTTYAFANTINYVDTTIFALTFSPSLNTTAYPSLTVSGCTFTTSDYGVTYTTTTNPASLTGFNTTPYQSNLVSVTNIPSSVTSIGTSTFLNCTSLTSVTIPSSVSSIGSNAFQYCTSLTSVTIPTGVTSIQGYTFELCSSLTSVTIPSSVTSIGSLAFNSCTSLTSIRIPASVTSFGNNAFDGIPTCPPQSSLQQAAILYYGSQAVYNQFYTTYAFANTINYVDTTIFALTFSPSLNTTAYPSLTVSGCTFTTSDYGVTYTTTTNPASLTGFNTTPYQSNLVSVTNIPTSVTSIGSNAFQSCASLTSVTIPLSVISIGSSAFNFCTSLTSVTIPTSVTSIGSNAFQGCISLTSVTIPTGVTSIQGNTFEFCTSLTSVTIPSSVTSIGTSAFQNCTALNTVTISSTQKVTTSTTAFSRSNGKIPILYTTSANYPPNNTTLTNQFTNTYLIGGPTNYYTIQSNVEKDLSLVFALLNGTSAAETGFIVENYDNTGVTKDLNQIFEALPVGGTQAQETDFIVENYNNTGQTIDLNQIFKPI